VSPDVTDGKVEPDAARPRSGYVSKTARTITAARDHELSISARERQQPEPRPLHSSARNAQTRGTGGDDQEDSDESLDGAQQLLLRIRNRTLTDADVERLGRAADAYHTNRGQIPFDRCLGLRGASSSWRIGERNLWIARAAAALPGCGSWRRAADLETAWTRFLASGTWQLWRDHAAPPASATKLQEALFWASRHNRANSLSAKQIDRICGQLSGSKCR
jgi:hypothetical protein